MIAASRLAVIVFLLLLKCLPASASVYKKCSSIAKKSTIPQICAWHTQRDGDRVFEINSWDGSKHLTAIFFSTEEVQIASNPGRLDERSFTISPSGLVKRDLIERNSYFKNTTINGVFPQIRIAFLSKSESFRLRVQQNLQRLDLYKSKIEGAWGPKTYQALVAYNTIFNQTIFVNNKDDAEYLLKDIFNHQRFDYQNGLLKTKHYLSLQVSRISEPEAAARYAATGIWQVAPEQPATPDTQATPEPYIASLDGKVHIGDAIALPDLAGLARDADLATHASPAARGTEFDLDARGTVRPRVRPDDLVQINERSQLGGPTRNELALIRPKARPDFQDAKEKKLNLVENWAIHVGTYNTRHQAERVLLKIVLLREGPLKNALRRVLKNSNGYAAVFKGLSEVDAAQECEYLKIMKLYCVPIANAFKIKPNISKKVVESTISNVLEQSKGSPLRDREKYQARKALVIGNANYSDQIPLRNALNDARDVAAQLTKIGFKVTYRENLSYRDFGRALNAFKRDVENSDISLFYYAGHGVEVDRQNYFIPVDAVLRTLDDVRYEAVMIDDVISASSNAKKLSIVLIDACRDNPFATNFGAASRSVGRGLSIVDIEPTPNSAGHNVSQIISFAASSGQVAQDGEGRNSPYAMALIELLDEPNLEIGKLFRLLGDRVSQLTDGVQQPVRRDNLRGEDIFLVVE